MAVANATAKTEAILAEYFEEETDKYVEFDEMMSGG